jgi:hypothetical protein
MDLLHSRRRTAPLDFYPDTQALPNLTRKDQFPCGETASVMQRTLAGADQMILISSDGDARPPA